MKKKGFTPLETIEKQSKFQMSLTGFTLLELMVVVVIIAILASLAVPQYMVAVERARSAEGVLILGAVRGSQLRYYQEHGNYVNCFPSGCASNPLDYQIENPRFFTQPTPIGPPYGVPLIGGVVRNTVQISSSDVYNLYIYLNGEIRCSKTGSSTICDKMGYIPY